MAPHDSVHRSTWSRILQIRSAILPDSGRRAPRPRAAWILSLSAAIAALPLTMPPAANAHLSIIRQGLDSAGSPGPGDRLGWSVTAGDFNGDGYDDLAMGAPGESVSGLADAGAVVVSLGSPNGITHLGAVQITASSLGYASEAGAQFGFAVHAADINQDGRADLLIGAPYEDVDGHPDAGRFYFVFGTSSGLMTAGTAFSQHHVNAQLPEDHDYFGYAFATGNFDGDAAGYLDLAVGSPGESQRGGVVFDFLGGPFGPRIDQTTMVFKSNLGGIDDAGDGFGTVLAAGNLVGTAHDDLAIGSPGEDVAGDADAGRVWILQGSNAGLSIASPVTCTAGAKDAHQPGGRFGAALAVGQFFSGAYHGLAIGEPGRTIVGLADAGRVIVAKGALGGLDFSGDNGRILTEFSGLSSVAHAGDRFGSSIAAGEYREADGYDDVAVGAPGDGLGFTANAGQLQIFPGGSSGPTGSGWAVFDQATCNEAIESGDRFGASIAFGRFDNSDLGGFAVGAPNEDVDLGGFNSFEDAGQVHVIAPWRQVYNLTSYTAMMGDCYGNPLFSVRPFDAVFIASTTKIITVLLACEHIQAGLDPNTPYTVPSWVSSNVFVDGSACLPPLQSGETLTLLDLMYMCLRHSGNDAAFAVADIVYGGGGQASFDTYVNNVVAFVAEMNARAASLGMTATHFTNPPGYDWPHPWLPTGNDHRSTAFDMWLLGKTAIANSLFAQVCGRTPFGTTRFGSPYTVNPGFTGGFGDTRVIGLKDGGTPTAMTTGVFAAKNTTGPGVVVGSLMKTPTNLAHWTEPMQMMDLALTLCDDPRLESDLLAFRFTLPNLNTRLGSHAIASALFGTSTQDDMKIDLHRQSGSQPTALHFEIGRQSELVIDPGASAPFGIAPFESHEGYEIANLDSLPCTIRLHFAAGVISDHTIEADSVLEIPPFSTGGTGQAPSFTVSVENLGLEPASLSVQELYAYDLTGIGGPDPDPALSLTLRRVGMARDGFWVETEGMDPTSDEGTMFLAVHDPHVNVGVGVAPPRTPGRASLRVLPPVPNPTRGRARIGFELERGASVGLEVHDLQGRLVRRIPERAMSPGRWDIEWDGLGADGRPVRSGLYFYRATFDRAPAGSGTLVIIR
jgi:D-alanyl-D-alanine carboxypeptidase